MTKQKLVYPIEALGEGKSAAWGVWARARADALKTFDAACAPHEKRYQRSRHSADKAYDKAIAITQKARKKARG